ncbi:hypothetical protein TNCV_790571 [Trichonephila clavipes]|nr:hypothetical protein TNCV_790571 [Trichonephila clavipes]
MSSSMTNRDSAHKAFLDEFSSGQNLRNAIVLQLKATRWILATLSSWKQHSNQLLCAAYILVWGRIMLDARTTIHVFSAGTANRRRRCSPYGEANEVHRQECHRDLRDPSGTAIAYRQLLPMTLLVLKLGILEE